MYHDDDTDGNIDQLPTDWIVSDEVLAEMARDMDELRRNDAELTEEDLRAMEEQQRKITQTITWKTTVECTDVSGGVTCHWDRPVRVTANLCESGLIAVGATAYGRDVELNPEQHAALVDDARKRFNELAQTAIYAA